MEIRFTEHALARCASRRINPAWLTRQVETLPPAASELRWTFPNKILVVIKDTEDERLIITVMRKPRRKGGRRKQW